MTTIWPRTMGDGSGLPDLAVTQCLILEYLIQNFKPQNLIQTMNIFGNGFRNSIQMIILTASSITNLRATEQLSITKPGWEMSIANQLNLF